ncbi:Ig-like domain-containing protein [Planomicrobium sp. CPCC 101110]|uniref:Ig-like domain-containing protein n=1 Tax=Planomicrobium sp. CPCC 101110 TaxID=2599619 RepID=UPI0011B6B782|nr:Ig-like domain-containing protein [Planomicrobium sp. CPCC 101110]TWT28247.1 lytic transglycosylase domain-containing protein [Planomicrobium sp. CPCC 101110]
MKSMVLRAGLLMGLFLGLAFEETSAASDLASKCSAFGEIKKKEDPSFQHINCLLTNAALDANIPPEVLKAVAYKESDWRQYEEKDKPLIASDGGIGIMQITTKPKGYEDVKRLKYDIVYNIEAGVKILNEKYLYKIPKIKDAGIGEIENWYFPIMAYNGTKSVNSPLYQKTGLINVNAYQEQVFSLIKKKSFLAEVSLSEFPFKTEHFKYDPNSTENIIFLKDTYTLTNPLHLSNYLFKKSDQVIVTGGVGNLRFQPSTSGTDNKLATKKTVLEITGPFQYDKNTESKNQFVWLPVKTLDGKSKGFISSAYVKKHIDKTAPKTPTINAVSDKSTAVTGKAETNAMVYAKVGTKEIGKATSKNGAFLIKISKQKAGTSISVYAEDAAENQSASKTVKVTDKTAPGLPTVNAVTDKTTTLTGKAEKNATVYAKAGSKKIGKATAKNGAFSITISKQKAGTSVSVYAVDKAKNKGPGKTVKILDKTAPAVPAVNKITSKTVAVAGKGEKGAALYVYSGSKKIGQGTVDSRGAFKVKIKAQKKGSAIKVYAKDKSGNKSKSRTVKVS